MLGRRDFGLLLAASASIRGRAPGQEAPAVIRAEKDRPAIPHGASAGDVGGGSAVVWSRVDRPSRMIVEYATTGSFRDPRRVVGPPAFPENDFTAKLVLPGLPPGQVVI